MKLINLEEVKNVQEIHVMISINTWEFYQARFFGGRVKTYMIRERHYASVSDTDYININFNLWDENSWLEISGIFDGNAITAE